MASDAENANEGATEKKQPLFRDLNADDEEQEVTEIESLCMSCEEQGMTRLMLTKIPFFKEVVLCSFSCEHCGNANSEIQSAGRVQELGVKYTLQLNNMEDLNRQIVKSETGSFSIPALDFEQPATGKGEITTIEGLIDGVVRGLQLMQPQRRNVDPETADKIDAFIGKLEQLKLVETPFSVTLDDPSGNSFLENPHAPQKDPMLTCESYRRTAEQEKQLGLVAEDAKDSNIENTEEEPEEEEDFAKKEVLAFDTNCPKCGSPCKTNMKLVDIPFFKEVVIMATVCESCGYRDNEVKGGAGIEDKGTRITLKLTDMSDLSRDLLKSDTCGVEIPELELELEEGTLGGRFTTVEGLLVAIKDQLAGENPFMTGDSAGGDTRRKLDAFLEKLDKIIAGEMLGVHVILDDPAGNSYMQNVYAPEEDPEMKIEKYVRNFEQNDLLGLNEMKTENYNNDSS